MEVERLARAELPPIQPIKTNSANVPVDRHSRADNARIRSVEPRASFLLELDNGDQELGLPLPTGL